MEKYEEILTSFGTIRGMLHIPDKRVSKYPVVIFHGYFSANRVGPARLYLEIARSLENAGLCVGRFDCLGVGESDGDFSQITFESEVRDFADISKCILKRYQANGIIIVGHSMGANLVLYCARELQGIIKGLILVSPDIQKLGGIDRLFDKTQLRELVEQGYTIRKGLYINASFIENIRDEDRLFILAEKIHIPAIVIHGKDDELYSIEGSERLAKVLHGGLIPIEGGNHNYSAPESRKILIKRINEYVLRFSEVIK